MLKYVAFATALYLIWRYVARLPLPRWGRVLLSLLVVVLLQHHWLVSRFFGTMASPEIPRQLIMSLGFVFCALLLFACFLALRDILAAAIWVVDRARGAALCAHQASAHALLLVAASLAAFGVWRAVSEPRIRSVEITLPALAPEYDGYRVAHLTDLHISRLLHGPWLDRVVERTNALNADLIVISGDLVDGTPAARAGDYPGLSALTARDGVYGVPGNHEYYAQYQAWMRVFEAQGVRMLVNEHVVLRRGGAPLVLAGVADMVSEQYGEASPDLAAALANRPENAAVMLLDHRPIHARENAQAGVDLQFSGHTHGGHIRGIDQIVRAFNAGFVSGRYDVGDMVLFVSNGAGLWPGFPVRIGRPAEVIEVTLRSPARSGPAAP